MIKLIWATPQGDQIIADLARVSSPENVGKDSTKLIKYLIDHKHWSPFEMVNACFEITTTRDIGRQILRHRSFSFQEFSQRYASVEKLPEQSFREARLQDTKNRQNSLEVDDEKLQLEWEGLQEWVYKNSKKAYKKALDLGIAKEVARVVLPEGLTTTRMYMNGTLRSWIHFCQLRMGHGTQKETTKIATDIFNVLSNTFPLTFEALK